MKSAGINGSSPEFGALVVAGPSGVGKSTIVQEVLRRNPAWTFSVSATTRPLRPDEVEGQDYWHISRDRFHDMVVERAFLEYAFVFGNYYGTPRNELVRAANERKHLLIEIDTVGCQSVRAARNDIPIVAIVPPSLEELERRLRSRGTETDDSMTERANNVYAELQRMRAFDYVIVNDQLESAVERMLKIMSIVEDGLHHVAESIDWIMANLEAAHETRGRVPHDPAAGNIAGADSAKV